MQTRFTGSIRVDAAPDSAARDDSMATINVDRASAVGFIQWAIGNAALGTTARIAVQEQYGFVAAGANVLLHAALAKAGIVSEAD